MTKSQFWSSTSDISSIEDGLLTPNNQQVFLTASMAFLQRKLQEKNQKIGDNATTHSGNQRNYSNLLIFEVSNGTNIQRLFVRVKNDEKYDDIFKKESSVNPRGKLSFDQLLPRPRKSKPNNKGLMGLFKRNYPEINIIQEPVLKRSTSFFTVFKRSVRNPSQSDLSCVSCVSVQQEDTFETFKLPSATSQCSVVSGFEKPQRLECCESYHTVSSNNTSPSNMPQKTILRPDELDILRLIPSNPSKINGRNSHKKNKDGVPLETRRISDSENSQSCSGLRQRSSKLSVCLEDDEQDESDSDTALGVSNYGSCNLTDEVKSNFSTENLDVIMRRLMRYFGNSPACNKMQRNCFALSAN